MDTNKFIEKCSKHNWKYHKETEISRYEEGKREQYEIYAAIDKNPEYFDLFKNFLDLYLTD